jgi:hypothetical protein
VKSRRLQYWTVCKQKARRTYLNLEDIKMENQKARKGVGLSATVLYTRVSEIL